MIWKWLGALLLFPVQMVYLVVKAAVCLVLPPKLRDLSMENVLITGGGRGIGRHLAREFAKRGARKSKALLLRELLSTSLNGDTRMTYKLCT